MKPFGELNVTITNKPHVFILPVAIEKMEVYVQACDDEIGWLGYCTKDGNNYIIQDVKLFNQEVNGTTCEIDEKCVAEFAEDLLSKPGGVELCNIIRVWGHSHVRMGVSPSGQDEAQFERLYTDSDDFYIRIIANKQGDMKLDLHDCVTGVTYNNLQWQEYRTSTIDKESIIKEIAQKVKKKVYTQPFNKTATYYDTYDKGYWWGGNQKKNTIEEEEFEDIFELKTPDDLVYMLGLSEDDIFVLASCDAIECMDILNDSKIEYPYMLNLTEAEHVLNLVKEYVQLFEEE